jgi:integrase
MTGRLWRRCGCRDRDTGRQLGAACSELKRDAKHGLWAFAVDLNGPGEKRKTMTRGGFATKKAAQDELAKVTGRAAQAVKNDHRETVAQFLDSWLESKRHDLRPSTHHVYSEYVGKRINPVLGRIALEKLRHENIVLLVRELEEQGRGVPTIRKIVAVLRSALGHAVKTKRLTHNPALHVAVPKAEIAERSPWTAEQAARFLRQAAGPVPYRPERLAELFEFIMCTGLRRGEALALRWLDVDLEGRVAHVRRNLTYAGGKLAFGPPKTKGSAAGVGLSLRAVRALERQKARQQLERTEWRQGWEDHGLVFTRENGTLIRPEYALARFHEISAQAGLPLVRLHDLRHLAATLMLTSGVPLALVSKTLRHSQVSITADLYGHLTAEAAHAAADSLGGVLDAAAAELANEGALAQVGTSRMQARRPS